LSQQEDLYAMEDDGVHWKVDGKFTVSFDLESIYSAAPDCSIAAAATVTSVFSRVSTLSLNTYN